jgi:hypothetical protein
MIRWLRGLPIGLSLMPCLVAPAQAQSGLPYDVWQQHFSPDPAFGGEFGANMLFRDVNFDGFEDLISSDAQKPAGGMLAAGKAFILFGPTLSTSIEIVADQPAFSEKLGWRSMSMGDANADGEYDILLGSPGFDAGGPQNTEIGRAHLFLGPDFATDIVFNAPVPEAGGSFGWSVELGDIDADGLDDVAVGAPDQSRKIAHETLTQAGRVWIWRGSNLAGAPVELVQPTPAKLGLYSQYLRAVPNGRGAKDLLVDAPNYPLPGGQLGKGYLYRFSGPNFSLEAPLAPPSVALYQYARMQDLVDVDHDGIEDMLMTSFEGLASCGVVRGPDFGTAMKLFPEPAGYVGADFGQGGALSDLDRDGAVDVLVRAAGYSFTQGAVYVYWGPDHSRFDLLGPGWFSPPVAALGKTVGAGDVDGDGYDEIFAQTPGGFSGGVVFVFHRRTLQASAAALSIAAGGSISFTLEMPPDQAGRSYIAALSLSAPDDGLVLGTGSYLPLKPDGMTTTGLSLLGTPVLENFVGTLDAQGDASFTLHWPAHKAPSLAGQTLHVAALVATADDLPGPGSIEATVLLEP